MTEYFIRDSRSVQRERYDTRRQLGRVYIVSAKIGRAKKFEILFRLLRYIRLIKFFPKKFHDFLIEYFHTSVNFPFSMQKFFWLIDALLQHSTPGDGSLRWYFVKKIWVFLFFSFFILLHISKVDLNALCW